MDRTILVHLTVGERTSADALASLAELEALARASGAQVVRKVFQTRAATDARTLIGSGKIEELKSLAKETGAEVILFDQDLKPSQQRNLEKILEMRVIDRTQLILDIFARRARSNEGKLQVELAQLSYLLPRLA